MYIYKFYKSSNTIPHLIIITDTHCITDEYSITFSYESKEYTYQLDWDYFHKHLLTEKTAYELRHLCD